MALYMNGQEISQSSGVPIAVEGLTEIDSTGTAADILDGKIVYGYDSTSKRAKKLTGTMANNGAVAASIDGLTTMSYTIPAGYHNGSGKVTLTDDIENAKTAIATAIEGKGVTVPDGTLLDGMASLIESIEAGGGEDFSPFSIITWGTYVPAEDENSFSVPNLTGGENAFFVISRRDGSIGSNNIDSAFSTSMYNQMQRLKYSRDSYHNGYPTTNGRGVYSFGNYYLKAGVTYWYAYGGKS